MKEEEKNINPIGATLDSDLVASFYDVATDDCITFSYFLEFSNLLFKRPIHNNLNRRLRPKPRVIIEMQFTILSTSRISQKKSICGRKIQPCFNLRLALTEYAQIVQISIYC